MIGGVTKVVHELFYKRIHRDDDIIRLLEFLEGEFSFYKPVVVPALHLLLKLMEVPLRVAESIDVLTEFEPVLLPVFITDLLDLGIPGQRCNWA